MPFFELKTTPKDEIGLYCQFAPSKPLHILEQDYYFNKSLKPLVYTDLILMMYWDFNLKDILPCWSEWYGVLINDRVKQIIEQFNPDPTVFQLFQFKMHHRQQVYDYYWLPFSNKNPQASENFDLCQNGDTALAISESLKMAFEKEAVSGVDFMPIETLSLREPIDFQKNTLRIQPLEPIEICVLKKVSASYLTKDKQYIKVVAEHLFGQFVNEENAGYLNHYPCYLTNGSDLWFNLNHFEKNKAGNWVLEIRNEMLTDFNSMSIFKKNAPIFCVSWNFYNQIPALLHFVENYYKIEVRDWLKDKIAPVWGVATEKLLWENIEMLESHFFGYPSVPDHFEYPHTADGQPLAFLCQLNISDLKEQFPNFDAIKNGGMLSFFLDIYYSDKSWPQQKDRFKVFYFPKNTPLSKMNFPKGIEIMYDIQPLSIKFSESLDWDNEKFEAIPHNTKDEIEQHLIFIKNLFDKALSNNRNQNKLFGFPISIQNDVRFEAEFLSRQLQWTNNVSKNKKLSQQIMRHIDDWQLLFQIEDARFIGLGDFLSDAGIYFMIRKRDLENNNFDDIQVILQNT